MMSEKIFFAETSTYLQCSILHRTLKCAAFTFSQSLLVKLISLLNFVSIFIISKLIPNSNILKFNVFHFSTKMNISVKKIWKDSSEFWIEVFRTIFPTVTSFVLKFPRLFFLFVLFFVPGESISPKNHLIVETNGNGKIPFVELGTVYHNTKTPVVHIQFDILNFIRSNHEILGKAKTYIDTKGTETRINKLASYKLFNNSFEELKWSLLDLLKHFSQMNPENPDVPAEYLDFLNNIRRDRAVNLNMGLDLNSLFSSVFGGLFNIIHAPDLKILKQNQASIVKSIKILAQEDLKQDLLIKKAILNEKKFEDISFEIFHQFIMNSILRKLIHKTSDLKNGLIWLSRGRITEWILPMAQANEVLNDVKNSLVKDNYEILQSHAIDLYGISESDFYFEEGKFYIFTYLDAFEKDDYLKLFEIVDLPLLLPNGIQNDLFELFEPKKFLGIKLGLKSGETFSLSANEVQEMKKVKKNVWLMTNPIPILPALSTCLSNLYEGKFKYCKLELIPKELLRSCYYSYSYGKNLIFYFSQPEKTALLCSPETPRFDVHQGYQVISIPPNCILETNCGKFPSKKIQTQTFKFVYTEAKENFTQEENQIFDEALSEDVIFLNKTINDFGIKIDNVTGEVLENNDELSQVIDDMSEMQKQSDYNDFYSFIGTGILAIILFCVVIFMIYKSACLSCAKKENCFSKCCCCCSNDKSDKDDS